MTPYERVLAEPGSIAARTALAASGDPRKPLIEKQLAYREFVNAKDLSCDPARRLDSEINSLIATRGREWAGRVADLVSKYEFHRGAVAQVKVSGEAWPRVAAELMALAPIQHLDLIEPLGDLAAVFAVPEFARLASFVAESLGAKFGDAGAIALAKSPNAANLRYVVLADDAIGEAGAEALAASPYLANARYVSLDGNPANPTPVVYDYDMVKTPHRPPLATRLEQTFGPRPWLALPDEDPWPPWRDELAISP